MPNFPDPAHALGLCREKIDEVDVRIVSLLNERTCIVQEIGRIKQESQLSVYEPRREDQVFANITAHNAGPLSDGALKRIYERLIDEMRKVQKDRMENTQ